MAFPPSPMGPRSTVRAVFRGPVAAGRAVHAPISVPLFALFAVLGVS
ncbi:MAG TPA: hypothetical protein VII82_12510 [Polyangiaceae bacterium]|jgi:hypothetical protein